MKKPRYTDNQIFSILKEAEAAANEGSLTGREKRLVEWLRDNSTTLTDIQGQEPPTLLHGDVRLDNICFDDTTGDVMLFDWQTMSVGPAGLDLAYFLSATLPVDTGNNRVDELVRRYHAELVQRGVTLSIERLRWQYEIGMLAILHRILPTLYQDELDLGSDRGPKMIRSWVERTFRRLADVEFESILARAPA